MRSRSIVALCLFSFVAGAGMVVAQQQAQSGTRREPQFVVGDVVIIKRGVLGSFLLTLQKGSATTRVQRIS